MVLAVVVVLYLVATSAGSRNGGGGSGGDLREGLPAALGRVLVQPAGAGDLNAVTPSCRSLVVPAKGECAYRLKTGFLARRLRLRLTSPGTVTAVLHQPKPEVTDTETLDAANPTVDLDYSQERSTLVLTCTSDAPCRLHAG